jgi:hypothetical protein
MGSSLRPLRPLRLAAGLLAALAFPATSYGYAALTHEALVDAAWDDTIAPALLARFPDATPADLDVARAYVHGGAVAPDLGNYPHGDPFVVELVHGVRTGDFVEALLRGATDLHGYAFALGVLSHHVADASGHGLGTNRVVPLLYPELGWTWGPVVTWEQGPHAHAGVEFGFDVMQVARGASPPPRDGFAIDLPLFEQAFRETYGLELRDLVPRRAGMVRSTRRVVTGLLPVAAKVRLRRARDELAATFPELPLPEASWRIRALAGIAAVLPPVGALRLLRSPVPTRETDELYRISLHDAAVRYREAVAAVRAGAVSVAELDLDTGEPITPGRYRTTDRAHAELLRRHADRGFACVTPELRAALLDHLAAPDACGATWTDRERRRLAADLAALRALDVAEVAGR